ncbi:MAG: hypothetical protein JO281_15905 [Pseudonocardiales bacterium]|nr:hypothetical protein [Pseudonocardiales bacterium]
MTAAVCDGTLSGVQCEAMAELLHRLNIAVVLEPGTAVLYPDNPDRQGCYVVGCCEPVGSAYAELVAAECGRSGVGGVAYRAGPPGRPSGWRPRWRTPWA